MGLSGGCFKIVMLKRLFSFLAAGVLVSAPAAFAAPMLSLFIQEDALAPLMASSGTGFVQIPGGAYNNFNVTSASGAGSPILTAPGLNLQTLAITTNTLASSHTLTVILTQSGLTGVPGSLSILNSFQGILEGVTSETITSYIDPTNAGAANASTQIATVTFSASGANAVNLFGPANLSGLYSETEIITAVFAPTATGDSLNSSAVMSTPVPEPIASGLVGAGMLGFALVRRRRSSKK